MGSIIKLCLKWLYTNSYLCWLELLEDFRGTSNSRHKPQRGWMMDTFLSLSSLCLFIFILILILFIYLSRHLWIYIFKAMIIISWNGSGDLSSIFDGNVFKKVLSIFITAAILKLAQGKEKLMFISKINTILF